MSRRFHYDIIVLDARIKRMLIDLVRPDRVVMESDFPQRMNVRKLMEFVDSIPGLTPRERELLLTRNAERLLKL